MVPPLIDKDARDVPAWCPHVPEAFQATVCATCACSNQCWTMAPASWAWVQGCCRCRSPGGNASIVDASPPSSKFLRGFGNTARNADNDTVLQPAVPEKPPTLSNFEGRSFRYTPAWCDYVPRAFRDVSCTGCTCQSFCRYTRWGSWRWDPSCCGCRHWLGAPGADLKVEGQEGKIQHQWIGTTPMTSGFLDEPLWCQQVPQSFKNVACSPCSCEEGCLRSPQSSWVWSQSCCRCRAYGEGDMVLRSKTMLSTNGSSAAPQPLTRAQLIEQAPAWCVYIPPAFRAMACTGCQCLPHCHHGVRGSWMWRSDCCSCRRAVVMGPWEAPSNDTGFVFRPDGFGAP